MGMIEVTAGLQFRLLDEAFYCSISGERETDGKHLLACKVELSQGDGLQRQKM